MKLRPKAKSGIGSDSKNKQGTKGDFLRILLLHGDLVVMHGSGIQKLYEVGRLTTSTNLLILTILQHAVEPKGKLRFALTCRYIRPELLADDEERRQAAMKSQLPDGHEQDRYDGDMNSTVVEVDHGSETVTDAQKAMNNFCARVHSGEIDLPTLRQCHTFLNDIIEKMAMPMAVQSSTSEMEGVESTTATGGQ